MAYIKPRVQIEQEFTQNPTFSEQPLPACIVGPQYGLYRYDVAAEKPLTVVTNPVDPDLGNAYDPDSDLTYAYPNQPVGSTVDLGFTEVFFEDAAAQYLPSTGLGSNSGNQALELVETAPSSGVYINNRVRFTDGSGTVLKTANGVSRSNFLSNRDAQVGDLVKVTDNLGNTLNTKVKALIADTYVEDTALAEKVGVSSEDGTDGVTNGTTTFTSASAAFAASMVGSFLTINTKGTFKILAVNSGTSVSISGTPSAGTSLTYKVGGVYNDASNVTPRATVINDTAHYVWAGSGSDPGTTDITVSTSPTGAYVGYNAQRVYSDRYTAEVTTGGTVLANLRFKITSQSGAIPVQENVALATAVLTLDGNAGNDVQWTFTGSTGTFVVGQTWYADVTAAVTLVNPATTGSTYTAAAPVIYKLTVDRGGPFYNGSNSATAARIVITSNNIDSSAPVLPVSATAFNVGNYGVKATFSAGSQNSGLIKGDVYYIPVVPRTLGSVKTLELEDVLPAATISLASTISATLYLVKDSVEIPAVRSSVDDTLNWVGESFGITINEGISVYDSNLVSGITPVALTLASASVYVSHRDLLRGPNSVALSSVTQLADVAVKLGTIDPKNPLAQGVYEAVNNSVGVPVYYIGLDSDDLAGYAKALKILAGSDKPYGLVPLTFDKTIQDAVLGHVKAMSESEAAKWRIMYVSQPLVESAYIYDLKDDGGAWEGTVTDNTLITGLQYTLLTVPGAAFITDGVRPTDEVHVNFTVDADGETLFETYVVGEVKTQTTLLLTSGPSTPINVASKVQINRIYTLDEQASNYAAIAGSYKTRRAYVVYPDEVKSGSIVKEGYFLAAAISGLASGVVPHQGLTNATILGFDDVSSDFNEEQKDVLADAGTFIVEQETVGATPHIRHQLSTDNTSESTQENSITRNVDSISKGLQEALAPFIGRYNLNIDTIRLIEAAINLQIRFYQTQATTATAGPQLLENSELLSIGPDETFKTRVNAEVQLDVPYPINNIVIKLLV